MRDKNRIKPFLNKLEELWLKYPDYRFGQLFSLLNGGVSIDPFYVEEDEWEEVIDKLITKQNINFHFNFKDIILEEEYRDCKNIEEVIERASKKFE